MVLPQESSEPIGQGVAPAPAVHDPVPMQEPTPEPVSIPVPEPIVEPEPEPMPEPDLAQQLAAAVIALRDFRIAHDDAIARQRKANMAVSDAEVQRDTAIESQQQAVDSMGQSRDDVLTAFDALISTVQAARDAFRAG